MTIALSEPTLGGNEARYLAECIESTYVSSVGPFVGRFEADFARRTGSRFAVACASGTAALHLALLAAGVRPGDEVMVSDLTFIASANAAVYCGAAVTLVDSERETWNIDPDLVVAELERRRAAGERQPAAIVAVHVLGQPAKMDRLVAVAGELGVAVVEDAAEALGARWRDGRHGDREVGTLGLVGCFSFNGNKIITSGGGGMVVTDHEALASTVRHLSTQARLPGLEYSHDAVGFNYRLTNLAAAVGLAQLEQLDRFLDARRAIARRYDEAFAAATAVTLPPDVEWSLRSGWMYTVLLPDRDERLRVTDRLRSAGVEARPIWVPLHLQAPYRDAPVLGGAVGTDLAARAISLPSSAHLTSSDQERVIEVVLDAVR